MNSRTDFFTPKDLIFGFMVGILLMVSSSTCQAFGLRVQPGNFLVRDVHLGEVCEIKIPLQIHNKDSRPHTYDLSAHKPTSIGSKGVEGYSDIPDPSWFYFERDEITLEADEVGEIKMYLKVPDADEYYDQKWVVSIAVEAKPEPGEMIALACYPLFRIETEKAK